MADESLRIDPMQVLYPVQQAAFTDYLAQTEVVPYCVACGRNDWRIYHAAPPLYVPHQGAPIRGMRSIGRHCACGYVQVFVVHVELPPGEIFLDSPYTVHPPQRPPDPLRGGQEQSDVSRRA